ncbi:MAG: 1-deoxy-D-xylulose-5-phosphate synthase [Anaerovoracaceae bacterium]|jgi:1-deoxy-D-xylulose-5-phosphate synthase
MEKHLLDYNFPDELKSMDAHRLGLLAYQIRDFLIEKVSKSGGHIASSLGTVELTLALHAFFDTPKDKIIWDVGHQAYAHKVITGRACHFDSLRQEGGISGFPKRDESPYDCFDSGHASNSVSAALGYAKARDLAGEDYQVIAVIGDGSLTGGIAFEGLNHAGELGTPMIVILNDNGMSIGKNTGSLSHHLGKLRTSKTYRELKKGLKKVAAGSPKLYSGLEHVRNSIKYAILPSTIFEELGFTYLGPIDGHNIQELLNVFEKSKSLSRPVLVHIMTKKGKGYFNAEKQPEKFHGIGPFNPSTGAGNSHNRYGTFSNVFGHKLMEMAQKDDRIVAISAAMVDGAGLTDFAHSYPNRIFDVGIAEQHAVSFASGLALGGFRPVVAIYSTFLQRSYDQILMDVCLQNLPVIFAVDRAGNVGSDGATHHGLFDLAYLSSMPGMTIMMPSDGKELTEMMDYALKLNGPCAIRYPRGEAPTLSDPESRTPIDGKAFIVKEGKDLTLIAGGKMLQTALIAENKLRENGLDVEIIDPRFLNPLDWDTISTSVLKTGLAVTLEDHVLTGGLGSAVASALCDGGMQNNVKLLRIAWPDEFIGHGNTEILAKEYEIDPYGVIKRIGAFIEREN